MMATQPRPRKCLHCRAAARARGLCQTHYQAARNSIKVGEVSGWAELIELGWALESRPGRHPNKLREKILRLKTTKGKP